MDKKNTWCVYTYTHTHTYKRILFSHNKKGNHILQYNNEPSDNHYASSNPEYEEQGLY